MKNKFDFAYFNTTEYNLLDKLWDTRHQLDEAIEQHKENREDWTRDDVMRFLSLSNDREKVDGYWKAAWLGKVRY